MEERKIYFKQEKRMPEENKDKLTNLNLKITEDERWAFKELCVRHRMSQVDGFRMAVTLLEAHLGRRANETSAEEGPA